MNSQSSFVLYPARLCGIQQASSRHFTDPLSVMRRPVELAVLGLVLCLQTIIYAVEFVDFYDSLNWFTPSVIVFTLGWSCYRIASQGALTIWTPLFWFRLACAVYYGIGPLVPLVADYDMARSIQSVFILDSAALYKVNLITLAGIFLVLLTSSLCVNLLPNKYRLGKPTLHLKDAATMRFAVCFLLAGAALRYGLILPYTLGLTVSVLPGIVIAIGKIYYAGIYLLIRSFRANRHGRVVAAVMIIIIEIIVSVASFAKTDLILILVFSFMGLVENKKGMFVKLAGVISIALVYLSFQSLVMYGRDRVVENHGSVNGAGFGERLSIIRDYLTIDGRLDEVGYGNGLSRLSYASANAFVIAQHDAGIHGDTLRHAGVVFVPRAIWPDKPIITKVGEDLYFSISGRHGSSMAVGHFSEAYWNLGWTGLFILMLPIGILLTVYSRVSLSIMARQDWIFLPVVFMGVQIGLRVDGHFVADVVGASWMALVVSVGLSIIARLTSARQLSR